MKLITTLFFLLFTYNLNIVAGEQAPQDKNRNQFSIEEFLREYDEFIIQRAGLTPNEAEVVCPLLHEMSKQKHDIDVEVNRIYRRLTRDTQLAESDYEKGYKEIRTLKCKKQTAIDDCYNSMTKKISGLKAIKVLGADERFHHYYIKKMMMKNPPKPKDGRQSHGPATGCSNH